MPRTLASSSSASLRLPSLLLLATVAALAPFEAHAQSAGDFRSAASGDWSAAATWERFDGASWQPAPAPPSAASAGVIVIRSPHAVSVSAAASADLAVVESGAALEVTAAGTLSLADGPGNDLLVAGTLGSAGAIAPAPGATIAFDPDGRYVHRHTTSAGAIPPAEWDATSRCVIAGYTSNTVPPANLAQAFGDFEWNCPLQTGAVNLGGALVSVAGDLVIASTGTGSLRLAGNGAFTTTVGGDLVQGGGTLVLTSLTGDVALQVEGRVQQTAGILDLQLSGAGGQAELRVRGDASFGGQVRRSGSATPAVVMNGTGAVQSFASASALGSGVWLRVAPAANVALGSDLVLAAFTTLTVSGRLNGATHAIRGHTLTVTNGGACVLGPGGFVQTGTGTLNVNAGGLLEARGYAIGMAGSISASVNVAGTLRLQGGALSVSGGANPVNVSAGGTLDLGGGTLTLGSGTLAVFPGGTLACGAGTVGDGGAGGFVLSAGALLRTGAPDGLAATGATGSIRTAGRTYSKAAHYVYDGGEIQITGFGLPDTVGSLGVFASDSVALVRGVFADSGVTVGSGTLLFDGQSLGSRAPFAVFAAGRLVNTSAGTLTLGGGLVNDGEVLLNGGGPGCADPDVVLVRSRVPGVASAWSGGGAFSLFDVTVIDQSCAPGLVTVLDGTDAGGNAGWTFAGCTAGAPRPPAAALELAAPAPNPARGVGRVSFTLPRAGHVTLALNDVAGRRVRALVHGEHAAGSHTRTLDTRGIPPGLYWLRLAAPGGVRSRALVIAR